MLLALYRVEIMLEWLRKVVIEPRCANIKTISTGIYEIRGLVYKIGFIAAREIRFFEKIGFLVTKLSLKSHLRL
jgi:hypothetical protein